VSVIVPHRLRAPVQDCGVIAVPPLDDAASVLADNGQRLASGDAAAFGRPLPELRRWAQAAVLDEARAYLLDAGEPLPEFGPSSSFVFAGHQPELFHPGVWAKNFALNGLARMHGAVAVNLVVDNDTAHSNSLPFPAAPDVAEPETAPLKPVAVPFDLPAPEEPYEERAVRDETLFAGFADRAAAVFCGWGFEPILPALWAEVRHQAERTPLLGERFAAARRGFERSWGCHNFEVPLSRVCRTAPFRRFAGHLLANLPRFHGVYNTCLGDYRRAYRLRSRSHPVPDLAAEGDWLEAPFWVWRVGRPRRDRLMARVRGTAADLRFGAEAGPTIPLPTPDDPERGTEAWHDLERRGLKVRSRALTTTLFARLFLSDLFVHGIGGAKYDELTDEIIRRFYHLEPPAYLVLSGTLLLPLPSFPVAADKDRRLAHELHDLQSNPQRHLADGSAADPQATALVECKRQILGQAPADHRGRRERYHALQQLTARLRPYVADQEARVRQAITRTARELQANAVLRQRDYAFCLFPESKLRPFCTQFLALPAADH
jgi:hypothetical protein